MEFMKKMSHIHLHYLYSKHYIMPDAEITDWKINVRSSEADVGAKLADFFLKIDAGLTLEREFFLYIYKSI